MNEDAGTVDYLREVAPAREGGAYLRAVPRPGGGTVIVMTLPLLPDTDLEDISTTPTAELAALADLLAHMGLTRTTLPPDVAPANGARRLSDDAPIRDRFWDGARGGDRMGAR